MTTYARDLKLTGYLGYIGNMTDCGSSSIISSAENNELSTDSKKHLDVKEAKRGKSAPSWFSDNKESPQRLITEFNKQTIRESSREDTNSDRSVNSDSAVDGPTSRERDRRKFKSLVSHVQRHVTVTNLIRSISTAKQKDPEKDTKDTKKHYHPDQRFENTHKMEPDRHFSVETCERIISEVLNEHLSGVKYDREECGKHAKNLSQTIMVRVKQMTSVRHKYVCHVILGAKQDQSVQMSSRCAWNPEADNFASANFQNSTIFAVGSVYGVYFE